jgi:hypothetical protein
VTEPTRLTALLPEAVSDLAGRLPFSAEATALSSRPAVNLRKAGAPQQGQADADQAEDHEVGGSAPW